MKAYVTFPLLAAILCGCGSLYYAANEKLGREKRDILASRIDKGRKEQEKAKEQFQSALQVFQQTTGFEGGELEKTYDRLNKEFERSEGRAKEVTQSIESIEKVANDLFAEWEKEIGQMTNRELRMKSSDILHQTQKRYAVLLRKMRASEAKMEPVLGVFRDQVLFLKHNLNARAVNSLKKNAAKLDNDVAALVKDIEASIQESEAFLKTLENVES